MQPHIARHLAIEDIVVDVAHADETVVAVYADVAECSQVAGSSGHVEGVEHSGEGRERVGARCFHLTHDVDRDGARLSERQVDAAAAVACAERAFDACLGLADAESSHIDRSEFLDDNLSVGRDGAVVSLLRSPIDIDRHGIARPEHIALWRGDVHGRLKGEVLVVEDVASEDLFLALFLFFENLVEPFDGVLAGHHAQRRLHLQEVLVVLVVFVLPGGHALQSLAAVGVALLVLRHRLLPHLVACLPVVGAKPAVAVVGAGLPEPGLRHLPLILFLDTAYLVDVDTVLHEFHHNLFLRGSLFDFALDHLGYLVVGHRRLGFHADGAQGE